MSRLVRVIATLALLLVANALACRKQTGSGPDSPGIRPAVSRPVGRSRPAPAFAATRPRRDYKVVHVFVVLADNEHQGIVPVPEALGNGRDPNGNLYWGAQYGVRTFLARSPHWRSLPVDQPGEVDGPVLRRALFRIAGDDPVVYVLAEAYDGQKMAAALSDFLEAAAGMSAATFRIPSQGKPSYMQAAGSADLVCFVGHNGLMDAPLESYPANRGQPTPFGAVVLACKSRDYFAEPLRQANCPALVLTTGLMAPEAYTLDAIIRSWAAGETPQTIRKKAAEAYCQYQKDCTRAAAERIFTGDGG